MAVTLAGLSVHKAPTKLDIVAVFEVGGHIITKQSALFQRGAPDPAEAKYMLGKGLWEAIQDAAYREHGDAFRDFLPSEGEYERVTVTVLKRAAELQPEFFAQ